MSFLELVGVVVRELFAGLDVANRLDPDASVVDHRIAVRPARVVDEAGLVAIHGGVDDDVVVNREEVSVMHLAWNVGIACVGLGGCQALPAVFDQARAATDAPRGERAAAMNRRVANLEGKIGVGRGSGHPRKLGAFPRADQCIEPGVDASAGPDLERSSGVISRELRMLLERRTVSRKTPNDGKLEISRAAADAITSVGAGLTAEWSDRTAPAEIVAMRCTCAKGTGQHEHVFLQSHVFRALEAGTDVNVHLEQGPPRVTVTPAG